MNVLITLCVRTSVAVLVIALLWEVTLLVIGVFTLVGVQTGVIAVLFLVLFICMFFVIMEDYDVRDL